MSTRRRVRTRRYVAEGLTIMAGILAALLVDAAWGYMSDRVEEHEYLAGLRAEFREALTEIESDQARREEIQASVSLLLEGRQPGDTISYDELDEAVLDVLDYRFYTPSHPVLDELLSAGRLGLIRSGSLRFGLRQYAQERDRLSVVEGRDLDFVTNQLAPFLAGHVSLDLLAEDATKAGSEQRGRVRAMQQLSEFGSLLYLRWESVETCRVFGNGVRYNIKRVLEILDS